LESNLTRILRRNHYCSVLGWVVAASRKRGAFGKGGRVAGWPGSRVADLPYYFLYLSL
jgi:hypothetical protein